MDYEEIEDGYRNGLIAQGAPPTGGGDKTNNPVVNALEGPKDFGWNSLEYIKRHPRA